MTKEIIDLTVDSPPHSKPHKNQTVQSASSSSTAAVHKKPFKKKTVSLASVLSKPAATDHGLNPLNHNKENAGSSVAGKTSAVVQPPKLTTNPGLDPSQIMFKHNWTPKEHELFLMGLIKYGKGHWGSIAKEFVWSKSIEEVKEYGEDFFENMPISYFYYMFKSMKAAENESKGNSSSSNSKPPTDSCSEKSSMVVNATKPAEPVQTKAAAAADMASKVVKIKSITEPMSSAAAALTSNVPVDQQLPAWMLKKSDGVVEIAKPEVAAMACSSKVVFKKREPPATLLLFPVEAPFFLPGLGERGSSAAADHHIQDFSVNGGVGDFDLELRLGYGSYS
ncbi:Transcription factor DIVARICATA [Quillaja saponaria]|uniref:Transcription factor DIVARICATA n=1 Tax=Quillaja saponaria TaxID=32244 RepID=A0AAD7KQ94_QUISA|nr:Transcription factor DIVARICATA [Quillaja saponaria]